VTLVGVVVSGFVDNVPFLLAMIPVAQKVSDSIGRREPTLLLFALLVGSCLAATSRRSAPRPIS
jgi:Na+/H+ antiporter NhaD/arsenite permease-like protein